MTSKLDELLNDYDINEDEFRRTIVKAAVLVVKGEVFKGAAKLCEVKTPFIRFGFKELEKAASKMNVNIDGQKPYFSQARYMWWNEESYNSAIRIIAKEWGVSDVFLLYPV